MKCPAANESDHDGTPPSLEEPLADRVKGIDGVKRRLLLSYAAYLLLILLYAYFRLH